VIAKGVVIRTSLVLEDNVRVLERCVMEGRSVFIGRGTNILPGNRVGGPIRIGRYCAIAPECIFLSANHPTNWAGIQLRFYKEIVGVPLEGVTKGGIEVGSDVWLGTRVIVTPGVHVGDGAVIGAGSVVTRDVPPYSISAGTPARHIRDRFPPKTVEALLALKWWDWPIERIKRNRQFFTTDLNNVDDINSIVVD